MYLRPITSDPGRLGPYWFRRSQVNIIVLLGNIGQNILFLGLPFRRGFLKPLRGFKTLVNDIMTLLTGAP